MNYGDRYGDGKVSDEQVLNLVNERLAATTSYYAAQKQRVRRWYDVYRGAQQSGGPAYRNNVYLHMLLATVWSDVAIKMQAVFGQFPVVNFQSFSQDDLQSAQRVTTLISAQMQDANSFAKAVDFLGSADLYGTSVARYNYKFLQEKRAYRARVLDREITVADMVTAFDGPDWDVVDRLDFDIQPGARNLLESSYAIHQYYKDFDDLWEEAQGDHSMWDKAAVKRLRDSQISVAAEQSYVERRSWYRTVSAKSAIANETYAKPIHIVEMWGKVPSEFAKNGSRSVCITVANGKHILRYVANPFADGRLPFIAYSPMPDIHHFDGISKIEVGEKMQAAANKLMNNKLDVLDLMVSPMMFVSDSAHIDRENLFSKPGKLIKVSGAVDDSVIRPLQVDFRGVQMAWNEIEGLWRQIQLGTGIFDDVVMGAQGSDRQTAREYLGRKAAVQSRLALESLLAEKCFVEPLANAFHNMNRQWLPTPKMVQILGNDATINPITGRPYPKEPQLVELHDLNIDYRARAVGASQMLNRDGLASQIERMLVLAASNPMAAQAVSWGGSLKKWIVTLGLDPAEMLNSNDQQAQMALMAMQGGQPGGGGGLDMTALGLSPETVGANAMLPMGG